MWEVATSATPLLTRAWSWKLNGTYVHGKGFPPPHAVARVLCPSTESLWTFLEAGAGFRQYFRSGLFFEERLALGVCRPSCIPMRYMKWTTADRSARVHGANQPDFMPSVSLGLGYNLVGEKESRNLIWLRPKLYFQMPYKTLTNYHLALQVGFTRTL